ncbi:hypothetical protein IHE44_0002891 [Lamprotornis superbus]|uniref:Very-long-chain (3R)-3-hydroxyacyl-CoA dehydratase n=1 Tax=Lamprotornis superbus TaxID=245042 RepID=A0A835P3C0_9PASS|nr:hypothetical protein IHE44_0002891 [Lamprotornis superbus]
MAGPSLRPHVHWAQRHRELFLRVDLSDVRNPDITITDNVLHFRGRQEESAVNKWSVWNLTLTVNSCLLAQGHGAKGDNIYEFEIEFLEPVEPKPVCRMTQRQLNITVQKKESNWWERLTKQEKRPLFLAPDFDRWLDESDAEMELKEKEEEKISKMKIESRVPKDHSFYDTFHTISDMMYFCQTLALMEIMNSLIGLVRSPLIPSVVQVFGRNFVLFVILGSLEEMQSKPVVFFIFYFWSITELFRYPYYMLSCIGIEWKPLTWLRYTVWIPLYPLGGLAEGVFVNFRHLYKQRKQHLGPKKRKMNVLRGSSTCHFELLGCVRELEGGVGVGGVGEQGALPLQHVCHALQQLQEAKGQSCLSQTIQLLQRHKTPFKATPSLDIKLVDKTEETFSRLRMTSVFLFLSDPSVNFCPDNSMKVAEVMRSTCRHDTSMPENVGHAHDIELGREREGQWEPVAFAALAVSGQGVAQGASADAQAAVGDQDNLQGPGGTQSGEQLNFHYKPQKPQKGVHTHYLECVVVSREGHHQLPEG